MKNFQINTDPGVPLVFDKYPETISRKLLSLRSIIIETAEEMVDLTNMEETLKWGEPSYLVKGGSTIRIDWKPRTPNQYAIYFKCTTRAALSYHKVKHLPTLGI